MSEPFTQDLERDARLVLIAMKHGYKALCVSAMLRPEFAGGPDRLREHATWMRSDRAYMREVVARATELDKAR